MKLSLAEFSSNNVCSSNFFGWPVSTFFAFQIKITTFESSKPILTCFDW